MLLLFSRVTTVHGVMAVTMAFEFSSSMVWGAAYLYTPEVLPTPIRAVGLGACSATTRVAGMLSPGLGQMLSARDMLGESIVLYALIYAVGACVTCALSVETSGQALSDGTMLSDRDKGESSPLVSRTDAVSGEHGGGVDAMTRGGRRGYAPVAADPPRP